MNTAPPSKHCDLLVIGSGAGGMSAAVCAAHLGLSVIVVEKETHIGGTTAWSGGWMWVPRNPLAVQAGITEDIAAPRQYLQSVLGAQYPSHAQRLEAFLTHAPDMVQFYLDHTTLRFIDGNHIPDFHGNLPGAREGGRSICAAPIDATAWHTHWFRELTRVRPPRDILSFLGMSIGADVRHFQRSGRALDSFIYVARRVVRHLWQHQRYGQGSLRMGGNALVAGLMRSALHKKVTLLTGHSAQELLRSNNHIDGARTNTPQGKPLHIYARCGVVLACGGFPHDNQRKAALFAHAPTGREHYSAAPPGNTGDGIRLGEQVGAVMGQDTAHAGAWAPVSLVPRQDGSSAHFPHLLERGKPGLIAVDAQGERFVDEAGDYHSFISALLARCENTPPVQAWLICDHRFQRRWGLGFAKPHPLPLSPYIKSGYLQHAGTWSALARQCGIDPAGLERTIREYNQHAHHGDDPQYGRGSTPYDRQQGDPEHPGPNPCVAPIAQAPFYAVRIHPGSLGTFAGLHCNVHAQVLDATGQPIPGLYAAGNDMASIMGGHYPSGGITLGPAMTFGYILAHHAAGQALPMPSLPEIAP